MQTKNIICENSIKGTVSRDFLPSGFSLNGTSGYPDSRAKAVLNTDSNSRTNSIRFDYENRLRAMPIFLLDNAKHKFLFYCHEKFKITYG
jgi:hypothetical protein